MSNRLTIKDEMDEQTTIIMGRTEQAEWVTTTGRENTMWNEELQESIVKEAAAIIIKEDYMQFIKAGVLNDSIP